MFRRYILKRAVYGVLFNNVADKTLRAQVDEMVQQDARRQTNLNAEQLRNYIEQRRMARLNQYHLNDPLPTRIFFQAVRALKFDYGLATTMKAARGDKEVIRIILEAVPRTLILFTTEVILTTLLGVAL